ncbi:chaplin [Streptacidiphilus sp. PAMC 29251]
MGLIRKCALLAASAGALLLAGAGAASADSNAYGAAFDSPGVLSGNVVQIPVDIPVNVCGNSLNVIGLLNPSFGNSCSNEDGGHQDSGYHHGNYGPGRHDGWHATGWDQQGWGRHEDHDGSGQDTTDCSDS